MKRALCILALCAAACSGSTGASTGSASGATSSGGGTTAGAASSSSGGATSGSTGSSGSSTRGPPSFTVGGSLSFAPTAAWGEYLSGWDGGLQGSRDAYVFAAVGNNAQRTCSWIGDAGAQVSAPQLTLDTILSGGTQMAPGTYDVAPSLGSHAQLVLAPGDGGLSYALYAQSGSITFDQLDDARIAGSYSVVVGLDDGGQSESLSGSFDVPVCYH